MDYFRWKLWRIARAVDPGQPRIKEGSGAVWIHLLFGIYFMKTSHEHEKELFCVGNIAFVKCLICGHESIPWSVSTKKAAEWKETHGETLQRLYAHERGDPLISPTVSDSSVNSAS